MSLFVLEASSISAIVASRGLPRRARARARARARIAHACAHGTWVPTTSRIALEKKEDRRYENTLK
jgi:hypothetical protein